LASHVAKVTDQRCHWQRWQRAVAAGESGRGRYRRRRRV